MKVCDLLGLLSAIPPDFEVEFYFGHSQIVIAQTNVAPYGKAASIHFVEEKDLSDQEKHEG